MQKQITISDIFRDYGQQYIAKHNLKGQQKGIINLLSACRTSALGAHCQKCSNCGNPEIVCNSCRNRHCPLCQQKDKETWLEKRMQELLPVGYYHLVFTVPHQLNDICLQNKKVMYDILFKSASQTILDFSKDPKHLGANTGFLSVLHTWGQNMMLHPHIHVIIPAGGLSFDKSHWVHMGNNDKFFVHYMAISKKFKGKFLDLFKNAFDNNELVFKGKMLHLSSKKKFNQLKDKLYKTPWVVNIQAPFASPKKVLEYLSRYVFRIAITNNRIVKTEGTKVHFKYKDYRRGGIFRGASLEIDEFIKRFLLHTLPPGYLKVRYYGIFTNRSRKENISLAKNKINDESELIKQERIQDGNTVWEKKQDTIWDKIMEMISTHKKPNCPVCKKGYMRFAGPVYGVP